MTERHNEAREREVIRAPQAVEPDLAQRLIAMRHKGGKAGTWERCSEALGVSVAELRELSVRLRDADEWRLPDRTRARGASTAGLSERGPGRPRHETPNVSVNIRLPVDVANAIREVAAANNMREGVVVGEAMVPTRRLTFVPRVVSSGPPVKNVNVRIDKAVFDEFAQRHSDGLNMAIAAACVELLKALGCEVKS